MVSEMGSNRCGNKSIGLLDVNVGSKLDVSDSDSTCGLKGGVYCLLSRRVQSRVEKKGCDLISSASVGPEPILFAGSLSSS